MRFETRQRIDAPLDQVEAALLDPRYLDFLREHHGTLLEVQQLEHRDDGSRVTRRVRYRPKPVIERIGPKTVPPEWFAFVETSTYDRSKRELTFRNTPTSQAISAMLINAGTLRLSESGPAATQRTLEGEISLKLPFLLKPLAVIGEQIIRVEGEKILAAEVPVLTRFVREILTGK